MADKNKKRTEKDVESIDQNATATNLERPGYEDISGYIEKNQILDEDIENERHNNNAQASAADEQDYPRINTDQL